MVKIFWQNLFRFLCEGEFRQFVWFWMGDKKTAAPEGAAETYCFFIVELALPDLIFALYYFVCNIKLCHLVVFTCNLSCMVSELSGNKIGARLEFFE